VAQLFTGYLDRRDLVSLHEPIDHVGTFGLELRNGKERAIILSAASFDVDAVVHVFVRSARLSRLSKTRDPDRTLPAAVQVRQFMLPIDNFDVGEPTGRGNTNLAIALMRNYSTKRALNHSH
jgi:hypothetical protein